MTGPDPTLGYGKWASPSKTVQKRSVEDTGVGKNGARCLGCRCAGRRAVHEMRPRGHYELGSNPGYEKIGKT